jgi:site-specific DNA-methyltransferase (adenine-specific)/adenine-specific DNA-methyltransferase
MNEESREARLPYGKSESTSQYTFDYEPIRGYPELRWTGKRPFRGTTYFPAQLKESHGDTVDGWRNKLYWGDNLQVMSHLLREYRGKVKLIYIDPPFDSNADYKKKIDLRGKRAESDVTAFEEKQYQDIWTNDEYLQFMYERLILMRELLAEDGSIYIHLDWRMNAFIRLVMYEVFGIQNFMNEITWKRKTGSSSEIGLGTNRFGNDADSILLFSKTGMPIFNAQYTENDPEYIRKFFRFKDPDGRLFRIDNLANPGYRPNLIYDYKGYKPPKNGWAISREKMELWDKENRLYFPKDITGRIQRKRYLDELKGQPISNIWTDIGVVASQSDERLDYPTQKPETLLERIIKASSNPGDLVFDCFMGSGTTQAVAVKLGRRFLGADINLGAIQTTTKRLLGIADELKDKIPELGLDEKSEPLKFYTGFEVYNVNHYDFFRNELEAKQLLIEALELQKLPGNMLWDGEKDGWMVKILAVNRLATAADLNPILGNLDYKTWERRSREHPDKPVERIRFACMGHDPDLKAQFLDEMAKIGFKVELEVLDILRDRKELQFKREAEAKIVLTKKKLEIQSFYPMNLLQKLSLERAKVEEWRELVDSVLIDWNYDGAVFSPLLTDIPDKNTLVKGTYDVPEDAGTIRVKITDLIAESWEGNVEV